MLLEMMQNTGIKRFSFIFQISEEMVNIVKGKSGDMN